MLLLPLFMLQNIPIFPFIQIFHQILINSFFEQPLLGINEMVVIITDNVSPHGACSLGVVERLTTHK